MKLYNAGELSLRLRRYGGKHLFVMDNLGDTHTVKDFEVRGKTVIMHLEQVPKVVRESKE